MTRDPLTAIGLLLAVLLASAVLGLLTARWAAGSPLTAERVETPVEARP